MMAQIAAVEAARDAVVEKETPADTSERMIRDLSRVRGIGVESATPLVREAFCGNFANSRALGSYAGLTATPFASGIDDARTGHQQGRQSDPHGEASRLPK